MADGKVIIDTEINEKGIDDGTASIQGKMSGLGSKIGSGASAIAKGVAGAITVAGTAMVGFGTASMKVGADFDASMSNVQAISGATGENLEALRTQAKDLGASTVFSASEAADAMGELALVGFDTNEILGATPGVLNLASAAGMELSESAGIVSNTMNMFGMDAAEATRAADMFASAQANSGTTASELGQAMVYAGGAANSFDMDLAQTNATLGIFANSGLKGGKAGTSFVAMLNDMKDNAEDGAIAIGDTTVAIENANGTFRDVGSIMADVEKATEGMTSAQKDAALSAVFGSVSMKGVNAMLGQGSEKYKELEESIRFNMVALGDHNIKLTDAEGNLRGAKEIMEEVNSATEGMTEAQKEAAIETAFASKGIENMNEIMAMGEEGVEAFEEALTGLKGPAEEMGDIMNNNLAGDFKALGSAVEGVQIAFSEHLDGTARTVVQNFTEALGSIKEVMENDLTQLPGLLGEIVADMLTSLATAIPQMLETGTEIIVALIDGILAQSGEVGTSMAKIGLVILNAIITIVPKILQLGIELIISLAKGIINQKGHILSTMEGVAKSLITLLQNKLPEFLQKGFEFLSNMITGIMNNLPSILTSMTNVITSLISLIAQNLPMFLAKGLELIAQIALGILQNLPQILTAGTQIVSSLISGIGSMLGNLLAAVGELTLGIINKIKEVNLIDVGKNMIQGLVGGIKSMLGAVKDAITSVVLAPVNWAKDKLGIHSPSRVFRDEIGEMIPAGLAVGIDKNVKVASEASDRMIKDVLPETRDIVPAMATAKRSGRGGSDQQSTGGENANYEAMLQSIIEILTRILGKDFITGQERELTERLAPFMNSELAYMKRRG